MKTSLGPNNILLPLPAGLVLCGDPKKPNVIAIAWLTIVTPNPPRIGLSVDHRRYSYQLMTEHPAFTVNIPSSALAKVVDYCGIVSGREHNKIAECNLTLLPGLKTAMPIIAECPLNLECQRCQALDFGTHTFFVGEILDTRVDEDKMNAESQRQIPDVDKLDPLVYCSFIREYRQTGATLGNAFSIGRQL
jgi:flavin reductase (DIM6/NTAB) family NADH-FMN oxidoreductase RutF